MDIRIENFNWGSNKIAETPYQILKTPIDSKELAETLKNIEDIKETARTTFK